MGTQSRKEYLKVLEIFYDSEPFQTHTKFNHVLREALKYAIASIKVDLKYDLMFEGEDIYTKADMVAMLEDLDLQIDELGAYNLEVAKVQRLIRDRIDKIKENKE